MSSPDTLSPLGQLLRLRPGREAGNAMEASFTNLVQALCCRYTPGEVDHWPTETQREVRPYRAVFFTHYPTVVWDPNQPALWQEAAITLLCDLMRTDTGSARRGIDDNKIAAHLRTINEAIALHSATYYAALFPHALPQLGELAGQLGGPDEARKRLEEALTSPNRLVTDEIKGNTGDGNDSFYWFNAWTKLVCLGMDDAGVDGVIHRVSAIYSLPGDVSAGAWRGYRAWLPRVGGEMLAPLCKTNLTQERWVTEDLHIPRGFGPRYSTKRLTDGFAWEFIQNHGHAVRSSCFLPDTLVRLADGRLSPIASVRAGDLVATPSGPRRVLLNAAVPRGGRELYRFAGRSFLFSAAHPFRTAGAACRLASVSPTVTASILPMAAGQGVARLEAGTPLATEVGAVGAPAVEEAVEAAGEEAGGALPEELHDLVVELDGEGASLYFAGDEAGLFLVSSELPLVSEAPLATTFVMAALPAIAAGAANPSYRDALAALAGAGHLGAHFQSALERALVASPDRRDESLVSTQSPRALDRALVASPLDAAALLAPLFVAKSAPLATAEAAPTATATAEAAPYDELMGRLFMQIASEQGEEIEALASQGFRRFARRPPEGGLLSLTLGWLDLDPAATPPPEPLTAWIVLRAARELPLAVLEARETSRQAGRPFRRRFDAITYLAPGSSDEVARAPLTVEVALGGSGRSIFAGGSLVVHVTGGRTYAPVSMRLRDAGGRTAGTLHADLRLLSPSDVEGEQAARAGWTSEAAAAFASELGARMAAELGAPLLASRRG